MSEGRRGSAGGWRRLLQAGLLGGIALWVPTTEGQETGTGTPVASAETIRGLHAEAATLLLEGSVGGSLPVAMRVDATREDSESALFVQVEVPDFFLEQVAAGREELAVEFFVYVLSEDGAVLGHRAERVVLAWAGELDLGERMGLRFRTTLPLPDGEVSLRCLVLEPASRRFALERVEVEAVHLRIGAPWQRPSDSWIDAGVVPQGFSARRARPILLRGEEGRLRLDLEETASTDVEVELRSLAQGELPERRQARLEREQGEVSAHLLFSLEGIEAGAYALRVHAESAGRARRSPELEVWVLDPRRSYARAWSTRVSWPAVADGLARERTVSVDEGAGRRRLAPEASPYRDVLASLGHSLDFGKAMAELEALERRALESEPSRLLELGGKQARVDLAVARRSVDAAVVVLYLHAQAYRYFRAARELALARHHRELAVALAGRLPRETDTPALRAAADVLTDLGLACEQYRRREQSRELLEQAVGLVGDHLDANLALAASYELAGLYQESLERTGVLLARNADDELARLRRATLLLRLDRPEESLELLERLAGEGSEPWIRTLAYEEISAILVERGEVARATAVLRDALRALPSAPGLHLRLAYTLDRGGHDDLAYETLDAARRRADTNRPSPRFLYTQPPAGLYSRVEERAAAGARVRLSALSEAVQ